MQEMYNEVVRFMCEYETRAMFEVGQDTKFETTRNICSNMSSVFSFDNILYDTDHKCVFVIQSEYGRDR